MDKKNLPNKIKINIKHLSDEEETKVKMQNAISYAVNGILKNSRGKPKMA